MHMDIRGALRWNSCQAKGQRVKGEQDRQYQSRKKKSRAVGECSNLGCKKTILGWRETCLFPQKIQHSVKRSWG